MVRPAATASPVPRYLDMLDGLPPLFRGTAYMQLGPPTTIAAHLPLGPIATTKARLAGPSTLAIGSLPLRLDPTIVDLALPPLSSICYLLPRFMAAIPRLTRQLHPTIAKVGPIGSNTATF